MDSSNASEASSPPLLPGFISIRGFLDVPNETLLKGHLFNIFGFLKEFQPPRKTSGTDWKCTFELVDTSVQLETSGVKIHIFWPQNSMPKFNSSDAVLVRNGKAQMRDGVPSIITNRATEIHLLPASQIPSTTSSLAKEPWQSYPPKKAVKIPTASETNYVALANEKVADLSLYSATDFQHRSEQAMNIKEKFALLKDVDVDCYYNLLGEVIRIYDAPSGQLTMHFSDYTAHSNFYDHVWGGGESTAARDGDEHGYIKSRPRPVSDWPGPYGKMSIQLTLFDEHATFAREQVKAQQWVSLKNVRILHGKLGGCIEGRLHGDFGRVHVEILERHEDGADVDARWKEAITRKRDYITRFAKDQKRTQDEKAQSKKRRREDEPTKQNAKARRKEKRAGLVGIEAGEERKMKVKLDLNENVVCESPHQPIVLLADLLKPRTLVDPNDPIQRNPAPFDLRRCRANVRVVDFFPPKIEDFAVGRQPSDFDMLSDYSGGEDTDPEEILRAFRSGKGAPEKVWEWRFALQIVDASDKNFVNRTWLVLNNQDAQMLLDMDATNLRRDQSTFHNLRERLCILWGDLEEQISAIALAKAAVESKSPPPSSYVAGDQPPLDSDDDQENEGPRAMSKSRTSHSASIMSERDPNAGSTNLDSGPDPSSAKKLEFRNKAFTCCIKQYGVKVSEANTALADAGDGKRWQSLFGLFGTKIR